MKKFAAAISRFFREVGKSCYDMEFYRAVRAESPWRSVAYAAKLFGFLAALGAIVFVPGLIAMREGFVSHVTTRLPDGARFELSADGLSTNVQVPFDLGVEGTPLLIDTSVQGTEPPSAAKSALVLGAHAAFFPKDDGGIQVVPYTDLPRFAVTKTDIVSTLEKIGWPVAALIAITLVLAWAVSSMFGTSGYVLLLSALAWVAGRAAKVPLRYPQWVAVGFRAITLPTLLMIAFGATLGRIPFISTVIYAMIVVAVIQDERANPSSGTVVVETQGPPAPEDKPKPPSTDAK